MNPEPLTLNRLHEMWSQEPRWHRLCAMTRTATRLVVLKQHGGEDVAGITADNIAEWLNTSNRTPADTVNALSAMRNMMTWAAQEGLWTGNADRIVLRPLFLGEPERNTQEVPEEKKARNPMLGGRRVAQSTICHPKKKEEKPAPSAPGKKTDVKLLGSTKWRDTTIGKVLDKMKRKVQRMKAQKRKSPTGKRGRPMPKGCAAYTDMQHYVRQSCKRLGYILGDKLNPRERMVLFVGPDTKRNRIRERTARNHGMVIRSQETGKVLDGSDLHTFSRAAIEIRNTSKKRGYIFGDCTNESERWKVYCTPETRRTKRTERALLQNGFQIVES